MLLDRIIILIVPRQAYLARIEEVNHKGPKLRAVIEINLKALSQAAAADDERKNKPTYELGSLHGIPILVKDNIATVHEEGGLLYFLYTDTF